MVATEVIFFCFPSIEETYDIFGNEVQWPDEAKYAPTNSNDKSAHSNTDPPQSNILINASTSDTTHLTDQNSGAKQPTVAEEGMNFCMNGL